MTDMQELARELGMGEISTKFQFNLTKFARSVEESARVIRTLNKKELRELIETFREMQKRLKMKPRKHISRMRTVSIRKWAGRKANKPRYDWSKKRKHRVGWKA